MVTLTHLPSPSTIPLTLVSVKRNRSAPQTLAREEDGPPETFGPVTLTRYVKDDARALILYGRRQEDRTTEDRPT
jgi:hypothetical protein